MTSFNKSLQYVEGFYNPGHENVYTLFTKYFENPIMTKLKNINGYTMYIAKINAQLGIEYRYIIVFVRENNKLIGSQEPLFNLKWTCLQTRTLTDDHKINLHGYIPRRLSELDKKIELQNKDDKQYLYRVQDLPIQITLLPSGKTKGLEYNSSGTIVTALETYHTIVSLI